MASIQKVVNKKGVSYRVYIRRKGLPSISKTFHHKKEASDFILKIEGSRASHRAFSSKMNFNALAGMYLSNDYLGTKPQMQRSRLKYWLNHMGEKPINDIGKDDINSGLDKLPNELSNATINKYKKLVSVVFNYGIRELGLTENPTRYIRSLPEKKGRTRYRFPMLIQMFADFPTHPDIRLASIDGVERTFDYAVIKGDVLFSAITVGIRSVLDSLEMLFVTTPWIVVISAIVLMTGLSAGPRAAIYSLSFLAYMGFLGFWIKAMTTLALLGTAAILSISIGIPLGIYCSTRPRFYAFIRPIMDFMQTMPAFVFMIPVIAFFGTGKVSAVIITMIFGGTPVVRLTVLGLKGVPESIREAAIAYGASKWYLLTKVDLPLAMPTILAGVNQTVMLSLAMVVVASLIGAKGLGQDVLEALQYANVGQGILAGIAILFCALILDRVIQGQKKD